jgi:hypothetical protein
MIFGTPPGSVVGFLVWALILIGTGFFLGFGWVLGCKLANWITAPRKA